ncbi:MAG: hypothetical protein ACI4EV_00700 [Lachnospiraceae bacterium]
MTDTKEQSIEELIYSETAKRLDEMQSPDYEFPKKIGKGDVVAMLIGFGVSVVLIALCMMGVIV